MSSSPSFVKSSMRQRYSASEHVSRRFAAELPTLTPTPRSNDLAHLSTLDLVPHLDARYERPVHLAPMVSELERAWREPVRLTCHAPPQHWKTDTVSAFVVATLLRHPDWPLIYATYSATLAERKSAKIRQWALAAGVKLRDDSTAKGDWVTTDGGGLAAMGIKHGATGRPARIILIDDPYGTRADAESVAYRMDVEEFYDDVAETRAAGSGSIFVWHTRWVPGDLIGTLTGRGVKHVHLPALSAAGEPLLHTFTRERLEGMRAANAYSFESLYQGRPRLRGTEVFSGPVVTYRDLPRTGLRWALGVDGAFSAKTASDYAVAWLMACEDVPANGAPAHRRYYVVDVQRVRESAPVFRERLRGVLGQRPGCATRWYTGGQEAEIADLWREKGVHIVTMPAGGNDKFVRAQPFATAWNAGHVLVPERAPWVEDAVGELRSFTGVNDAFDDQVDAGAAAFDCLHGAIGTVTPHEFTSPRTTSQLERPNVRKFYMP